MEMIELECGIIEPSLVWQVGTDYKVDGKFSGDVLVINGVEFSYPSTSRCVEDYLKLKRAMEQQP